MQSKMAAVWFTTSNIHDANFTFSEGKEAFSKRLVERRASTEW